MFHYLLLKLFNIDNKIPQKALSPVLSSEGACYTKGILKHNFNSQWNSSGILMSLEIQKKGSLAYCILKHIYSVFVNKPYFHFLYGGWEKTNVDSQWIDFLFPSRIGFISYHLETHKWHNFLLPFFLNNFTIKY